MRFARTLAAGILASTVTLSLAVIPSHATTRPDSPDKGATTLAASGADAGTSGVSNHIAETPWLQFSLLLLSRAGAVLAIASCKRWLRSERGRDPSQYQYKVAYSDEDRAWVVLYRLIHG